MTKPRTPSAKAGRPNVFTPDLADEICERLAEGESLRAVCDDPAMPSRATVMGWIERDEGFRFAYAEAKRDMLECELDKILEIADDDTIGVERRRLMIHARMWRLSKLLPKKYGERPEESAGRMNIAVTIGRSVLPGGSQT